MNKLPRWVTTALLVGTIIIVVVLIFVAVAAKYRVPVTSLLPDSLGGRPLVIPSPIPKSEGSGLTSNSGVSKVSFAGNTKMYIVNGKFVTKPDYNNGLLEGSFVINNDPNGTRVQVVMTGKDGNMSFGLSKSSLSQDITWTPTKTDDFKDLLVVGKPAQLRVLAITASPQDREFNAILDKMIAGSWDIPQGFVIIPMMVAIVQ